MIQRLLNSKNFVAFLLSAVTGMALYFYVPFPAQNVFLQLMAIRAPLVLEGVNWSYTLFLFTTPYIVFSILLSGLYIFALKAHRKLRAGRLPRYPDPRQRQDVFLVVGEVHNPRKPVPSETPRWLVIPQRGLFTGIALIGAIGTGKTSCCMYPFVEQLVAYRASDPEKKIGGLVLEVKGDFCHQVKEILTRHGRAEDYIEISLDSEYRYNPLHNDLDAYALAYSIASLLNNLFGKGKEPFWQQAYTNLLKFIILLHKITYDYVTLFDVYQCAISPDKLEKTIHEAEQKIGGRRYVLISSEVYFTHVNELAPFKFTLGVADSGMYRADDSERLRVFLHNKGIEFEALTESSPDDPDAFKREQLEAVKRWFYDDWRRIEPKLRTSIVEGISVFLSLFDDNPVVKRTFCPTAKYYDPVANADGKFGKPLPSFRWLIENGKVCALNFPIGLNPGLARALGVMMKLDFQRAVLNRVPDMAKNAEKYFREVFFVCDEYQSFATVGENEPTGDEKFFSLSRQPKCIPIVATQSISSLKSVLPGETWRTLLQTFRTKIFLALSDDFSARTASELCGREDKLKVSYNISESGHDARVSLLTGKAIAHRANVTASKSYNTQTDFRFDMKTFTELKNAQSIAIAYDGLNPMPPMFCYLKPHYNDVNKSYFRQIADGEV
ncbi:MAG TPA: type IV secretion system DNA-binding domain-containing protein [Candidatus Acidoferrales bacterium]|nr:type IV secretion system DNA-binding domain-containing protein [Candidatus Acidoferrales bacterium]